MPKPAALFVAAAMAVTAACVGVIVAFGLGYGIGASALAALAALALMAVVQLAFARAPAGDEGRLDDLDRVVTELQSRLETAELKISTLDKAAAERARAAVKPVVEEIAALGGLVTSIAKEVAAHDVRLMQLAGGRPAASGAPANPAEPPPASVAAPDPRPAPAPAAASARPAPAEPFDPDEPDPPAVAGPARADRGPSSRLELALRDDRVEIHLQPIVALPSRRTLHYEALSRLADGGAAVEAAEFVALAEAVGRIGEIDRRAVERACAVALRLAASGRSGAVFVNMSPVTLADETALRAICGALDGRSELARLIIAEIGQAAFAGLGPAAREGLAELKRRGVRVSLDRASDLRLEPRDLVQQGVRFLKVPAARLLDPEAARGAPIHPADLAGLLERHGIELVATHVEEERTVPELLDMDVKAAQGLLFGAARPVRPAKEQAPAAEAPTRLVPRSVASR